MHEVLVGFEIGDIDTCPKALRSAPTYQGVAACTRAPAYISDEPG
jgi:hypothetical protein